MSSGAASLGPHTIKKKFDKKKSVLESSETYAQKIFLQSEKKIFSSQFIFFHIFFVLKSSETYAKKILPSALFEGGGSADRKLGKTPYKLGL